MSGDMLNEDDPSHEIVTALISDLSSIAPVYFGYGNHEKRWEKTHGQNLRPLLEQAGASVVDNDYIDLELKGTSLRIGGYMAYYMVPHMSTHDEAQQALERAFAEDFENTDRLKILINHIPTGWVDWNYVNTYPVDIVFSGHYHGGMIRIPILNQGLYAPYVGLFPPFTKGVYAGQKATCILSAGLGIEHHIPRFYNPPEIVVVDLIPN
jgi:predicted MPP superfamily phosphohydrolase